MVGLLVGIKKDSRGNHYYQVLIEDNVVTILSNEKNEIFSPQIINLSFEKK